jgi:urea transport system ATP-binding protein
MAALTLEKLTVKFGGLVAVNELDLHIHDGELRCLLGPNGAGKSTTLDLICGKTKSTSGRVLLGDRDITHIEEFKRARLGVGRKFQTPTVFKELNVIVKGDVDGSIEALSDSLLKLSTEEILSEIFVSASSARML